MAEIILDCPACKKPIQADDAWAGEEINCPLCQSPMTVPGAPATHQGAGLGRQLVGVPGQTKLSAGTTQTARSAAGSGAPLRNFQARQVKHAKPWVKYVINGVVVVALLVGGWFAWPYVRPHLPFLKSEGEVAEATTASTGAEPATAAAEPAEPPPPKEVPMTTPVYTLDVGAANISEGKVNGSIAGTNFVPDTVRLDKLTTGYVLELREGSGATPDRGLRVYLRLSPTDSPTGHTWTVSQDMKAGDVSRLVRVWKTNPKYAAQEKSFATGYALRLELGQFTESNTIPGKIYAALPDKEQSVIGGVFTAMSTAIGEPGALAQPQANPQAAPLSPAFQERYKIGR
jgi:hypothetical protein